MAKKILVADDSLTIQKVINITLGNEDFVLEKCLSEKELLDKIEDDSFDIVLLDFSLSTDTTGYELAQTIKQKQNGVPVMVMLGTFDSVNDIELNRIGVEDKITKPFESSEFKSKIHRLLEEAEVTEEESSSSGGQFPQELDKSVFNAREKESGDENWVVDSAPGAQQSENESTGEEAASVSATSSEEILSEELESWGIELPGKIDADGSTVFAGDLPSVIDGPVELKEQTPAEQVESVVEEPIVEEPAVEELAVEEFVVEVESKSAEEEVELVEEGPKFEEIAEKEQSEISISRPEPTVRMTGSRPETDVREEVSGASEELEGSKSDKLENIKLSESVVALKEFADKVDSDSATETKEKETAGTATDLSAPTSGSEGTEEADKQTGPVSEESAESLWKADEETMPIRDEQVSEPATAKVELTEEQSKMVGDLKDSLTPILEQLVRRYCQETVEKVAWEIMPDLAENLIRKELEEISKSIEKQ